MIVQQMEATVEVVTPAKALEWLQSAARNRHITDSVVRRYGADMQAGRWTLNGQGIIFNTEGQLVDGRHRLTAVVATECEVPMLVVRGAPPGAFETMDSGRGRTLAHTLQIEGTKNAAAVSAAARIVFAYVSGMNLKHSATRMELLDLIRRHPLIDEYATLIANKDYLIKPLGVPRSSFAAILALGNNARDRDATVTEFIDGFITGEGLFSGDPRLTLRRWLARQRQETGFSGGRIAEPFFAALARAWSAFASDHDLPLIRLPMMFNRHTIHIEGFDLEHWGDVPDMSARSFAALGAEPVKPLTSTDKADLARWQGLGKGRT
ncbi:MAG TPA: hypothetical protein VKQ70_10445 [Caulobacteraceae bacterium]|nr:hypothetical protein [Caulobacteraceae bacterium]